MDGEKNHCTSIRNALGIILSTTRLNRMKRWREHYSRSTVLKNTKIQQQNMLLEQSTLTCSFEGRVSAAFLSNGHLEHIEQSSNYSTDGAPSFE